MERMRRRRDERELGRKRGRGIKKQNKRREGEGR